MGNSPTRSVSYKPRMTQCEAFDLLPPRVRAALREAVTEFDTVWCLNRLKGGAIEAGLIDDIRRASLDRASRPLIPARGVKGRVGYVPAVRSTYAELGIRPL